MSAHKHHRTYQRENKRHVGVGPDAQKCCQSTFDIKLVYYKFFRSDNEWTGFDGLDNQIIINKKEKQPRSVV